MDWYKLRAHVLERDKFICAYCVDEGNQVDHIIPVSQGGTNDLSNLVCACKHCNVSKGPRTPWQWHVKRGMILPPWWIKDYCPMNEGPAKAD